MSDERWLPVPGLEGRYSVSSHGRVRSEQRTVIEKTGKAKRLKSKVLSACPNRGGYPSFKVSHDGRLIAVRVHRAVAMAFIGPPPTERHEVAHRDGNRSNNSPGNLRWDTRKGNFDDKVLHGTHNRGERHPHSRLSNDDVAAIRASSLSNSSLATQFGVSAEHIQRVRSNKKRRYG